MYRYILALAVTLGGMQFVTVPAAQAQERPIRCESRSFRYNECETDMRRPRIIRQLSGSACIPGQSWGFSRGTIWVDKGCSAVFADSAERPRWRDQNDRPRWRDDRYPRRDYRREYRDDRYYQPDDY
ncbi:DUF3011 domain-containing protein [Phyllobacterium calauticae]|jgi:hypothetical protein|uniref:DUF3011 domain-containing protein n=1 Tax=Phyllobacterium calauticae TaxID=2817027 RepID=UPI001CBC4A1A|nr:DUF3011 domain-containing protein [Phyllobacterium calauticae]MBZ3693574.1 DUF3011 domain-containing protein [Phyllobacterium calauticae]|eukprot:gene1808-2231_t